MRVTWRFIPDRDRLAFVADAIARVCVSCAINPRDDAAQAARRLAELVVHGLHLDGVRR